MCDGAAEDIGQPPGLLGEVGEGAPRSANGVKDKVCQPRREAAVAGNGCRTTCLQTADGCATTRLPRCPIRGCREGPGLAVVLCTGAALRRPSVWPITLRKEGCFRPAVGR